MGIITSVRANFGGSGGSEDVCGTDMPETRKTKASNSRTFAMDSPEPDWTGDYRRACLWCTDKVSRRGVSAVCLELIQPSARSDFAQGRLRECRLHMCNADFGVRLSSRGAKFLANCQSEANQTGTKQDKRAGLRHHRLGVVANEFLRCVSLPAFASRYRRVQHEPFQAAAGSMCCQGKRPGINRSRRTALVKRILAGLGREQGPDGEVACVRIGAAVQDRLKNNGRCLILQSLRAKKSFAAEQSGNRRFPRFASDDLVLIGIADQRCGRTAINGEVVRIRVDAPCVIATGTDKVHVGGYRIGLGGTGGDEDC